MPDPGAPGPGHIRVRLHASSLNFHDYAVVTGFQLPTCHAAMVEPSVMSVRRDMPRHITALPGGGSLPRAR
jgi:NADPH:quinone reductase-like Zn-dependent oxidoreductase